MVIAKQIANSGPTSQRSAISTSYQGKNTYRTAQQIVRNCGLSGLYAGFQLQMGTFNHDHTVQLLLIVEI